jgi:hypothetical protein
MGWLGAQVFKFCAFKHDPLLPWLGVSPLSLEDCGSGEGWPKPGLKAIALKLYAVRPTAERVRVRLSDRRQESIVEISFFSD